MIQRFCLDGVTMRSARPEKKRFRDEFLEQIGFHRRPATWLLVKILRAKVSKRAERGRASREAMATGRAVSVQSPEGFDSRGIRLSSEGKLMGLVESDGLCDEQLLVLVLR